MGYSESNPYNTVQLDKTSEAGTDSSLFLLLREQSSPKVKGGFLQPIKCAKTSAEFSQHAKHKPNFGVA